MGRGAPEPSGKWGVQSRVLSQPSGQRYVLGRKPQVRGGSRPLSVGHRLWVNRGQRKLPQGFPERRVQAGVGWGGAPSKRKPRGPSRPRPSGGSSRPGVSPGAARPGARGGGPTWSAVPMATEEEEGGPEGEAWAPPQREPRPGCLGFPARASQGTEGGRRAALGEPGASGEGGTRAHSPAPSPGTPTSLSPWVCGPVPSPPPPAGGGSSLEPRDGACPSPPKEQTL